MKTIHTINLQVLKKKQGYDIDRYAKPLLYMSGVSLFVFMLAFAVTFFLLSFYSVRLQSYTKESEELLARIEAKRDVEAFLLTEHDKLSFIEKVMKSQPSFGSILDDVEGMLTFGIELRAANMLKDKVTSELLASSSADLANFVDGLELRDSETYRFVDLSTSSIERTEEGGYKLSLQLNLKKDGDSK